MTTSSSSHSHATTALDAAIAAETARATAAEAALAAAVAALGSRVAALEAAAAPQPVPPPPTVGVPVPASIDATGATDASAALNAWVASVPDGSTLAFAAGAIYQLSAGIQIADRAGLTFAGNGATLRVAPSASGSDQLTSAFVLGHAYGGFWTGHNSDITIRDFTLIGNSATPGIFRPGVEGQSALILTNTQGVTVSGITASAFPCDFAFVEAASAVHITACHVPTTGRNGLSVISGSDIEVDHVIIGTVGYVVWDIEPNDASQACSGIRIHDNTSGPWSDAWLAVEGSETGAAIHDLTITGNVSAGASLLSVVNPGAVAREQAITVSGNRSDTAAAGPVLRFTAIDGLTITGNVQPLASGSLAKVTSCTAVVGP